MKIDVLGNSLSILNRSEIDHIDLYIYCELKKYYSFNKLGIVQKEKVLGIANKIYKIYVNEFEGKNPYKIVEFIKQHLEIIFILLDKKVNEDVIDCIFREFIDTEENEGGL